MNSGESKRTGTVASDATASYGRTGNHNPRPVRLPQTWRHRQIVAELAERGAMTSGFGQVVLAAAGRHVPNMQPDAFAIDAEGRVVFVAEVEVTHPIDDEKWGKLAACRDSLAEVGWSLVLFCYGPDGGRCEIDIDTRQMTEAERERVRALMNTIPGFA